MSDMSQNLSIPNTEDAKLLQDVKQGKPLDFSFKFLKTLSSTNTMVYILLTSKPTFVYFQG